MAAPVKILTAEQERFLDFVSRSRAIRERFYFTGGTPLAAFYLHHRLSEDIDLFSEDEVNLLSVRAFIGKAQKACRAKQVDYHRYLGLHSFELLFSRKKSLKIDFNYYPFPRIENGTTYRGIVVDSVLDIAVNKVHTIAMRTRARDFIDLYFIVRKYHYVISDLLAQAKIKFDWHIDPGQLGSQFLGAAELIDYPRMIRKVNHREWKEFFVGEARKLGKEIFK